ncbi:Aste57867_8732 [Aphanomyces stellatus]|uniref:Aste57867_8732 protein n=1 Tax=Aphanomyces stellatus TaxID=120398 RepID=A0A485KL30_9STRA|nr:hypothetical protein As57867_008698 [Aphanomyces stellatus]VFT85618.1 Aste57867_8732 [Aphanomyces stellatus]
MLLVEVDWLPEFNPLDYFETGLTGFTEGDDISHWTPHHSPPSPASKKHPRASEVSSQDHGGKAPKRPRSAQEDPPECNALYQFPPIVLEDLVDEDDDLDQNSFSMPWIITQSPTNGAAQFPQITSEDVHEVVNLTEADFFMGVEGSPNSVDQ